MQEIEAPDGTIVEFPDGTPDDVIIKAMRQAYPSGQAQSAAATQPQDEYRGTILPFKRDADGNMSVAMPQIGQAVIDALTLPGDVAKGTTPIRDADGNISRDVIERSFDLGGIASPATAGKVPAMASGAMRKAAPLKQGQQVATSAQRLGVDLPRAITSDKTAVQRTGQGLSNVPIAGDPLVQASQRAIGQLDDAATGIQQGLGSGSRVSAGSGARADITDVIKPGGLLAEKSARAYNAVDTLVDDAVTRGLSATKSVADDIIARRAASARGGEGKAVSLVRQALDRPEGLTYSGLKDLRSSIGEMLNGGPLPEGLSGSELKRVYGALTDDLRATVRATGGKKAVAAFDRANKQAARIASERKELVRILGNKGSSDEAIFENVLALASNTTKGGNIGRLQLARKAVSEDTWREIGSAAISRLGRAPDGAFSPDRFLTSYSKLSPNGRTALFGRTTKEALDDLARVSTRFKNLKQFSNPSGTAQNLGFMALGAGSIADLGTTLSLAASGNVLARILARPVSAKQVSRWANAQARMVTNPSRAAQAALQDASRSLSIVIANESGAASAAQIQPVLQGISKVAAEQSGGDSPAAEQIPARGPEQYDPNLHL